MQRPARRRSFDRRGDGGRGERRAVCRLQPPYLISPRGFSRWSWKRLRTTNKARRGEASHATLAVGPAKESFICPEWARKRFGGTLIKQGGPIKKYSREEPCCLPCYRLDEMKPRTAISYDNNYGVRKPQRRAQYWCMGIELNTSKFIYIVYNMNMYEK